MTTLGILDIYDKINLSNGEYCKVCFKTSRERRLVNPVSFKRFLNAINGGVAYKTQIKVCHLCEALALSAMKFHRAVLLALEIEDLYQQIQDEGLRNVVWKHLNGVIQTTARNKRVCQRAALSQAELRNIQNAVPYSLQCTDTLVVTVDRPAEPIGIVQKPTNVPPAGARNKAMQSKVDVPSDVVIILDDDTRQAPAAAASVRPVNPVIQHQKMTVSVRNQETNQVILHPMVTGSDGNIYVPTLKLQILPNNVFKSVSDDQLLYYTINTPTSEETSQPKETTPDKALDSVDTSTIGYDYNTFLTLQNEGKMTSSNGMPELINTENMNVVLNFDDEAVNSKKKRYEYDPLNVDHNGTSNSNNGDASEENDTTEKRPLLSMDRVDWEDKIPMDVISFMDATDPNPSDRIMQPAPPRPAPPRRAGPLGFISDVRTVEEDVDVEILDTVECIDLC